MITEVIKLIQVDEWRGVSQRVEIAKGKNKYITRWYQVWNELKRISKWPKK